MLGPDGRTALVTAVPRSDPSAPATGATLDRLREALPAQTRVGGAPAENHDLEAVLADTTPVAIAVVLALGFLLLLVALQALLGVLSNLLAVCAAFGVARWIFQDGALSGLLGFESQGFLDAWGPLFFFAMIFAISMDSRCSCSRARRSTGTALTTRGRRWRAAWRTRVASSSPLGASWSRCSSPSRCPARCRRRRWG